MEKVKTLLGIKVEIVVNIDKNIEANPVTFYLQTKAIKIIITIKKFLESLLKGEIKYLHENCSYLINFQKFN